MIGNQIVTPSKHSNELNIQRVWSHQDVSTILSTDVFWPPLGDRFISRFSDIHRLGPIGTLIWTCWIISRCILYGYDGRFQGSSSGRNGRKSEDQFPRKLSEICPWEHTSQDRCYFQHLILTNTNFDYSLC